VVKILLVKYWFTITRGYSNNRIQIVATIPGLGKCGKASGVAPNLPAQSRQQETRPAYRVGTPMRSNPLPAIDSRLSTKDYRLTIPPLHHGYKGEFVEGFLIHLSIGEFGKP
jgi:hypothetical protein